MKQYLNDTISLSNAIELKRHLKKIKMKIIIFIALAICLAVALAAPSPEPEANPDPQYQLSEDFEDAYGAFDAYPDAFDGNDESELRIWRLKLFCRIPWNRIKRVCRRIGLGK